MCLILLINLITLLPTHGNSLLVFTKSRLVKMVYRPRAKAHKDPVSLCLQCQAEHNTSSSFCLACKQAYASVTARGASNVSDLWPSRLRSSSLASRRKAGTELAQLIAPGIRQLHEKHDALKKQVKALKMQLSRRETNAMNKKAHKNNIKNESETSDSEVKMIKTKEK